MTFAVMRCCCDGPTRGEGVAARSGVAWPETRRSGQPAVPFYFVNDGIQTALDQARQGTGNRDIRIARGAPRCWMTARSAFGIQASRPLNVGDTH